jgi:hypothetical protein
MSFHFWRKIFYVMDWEYRSKNDPTEETINNRHKVMDQIKYNTIKLKDIMNIKEKLAHENKIRRQKFMVLQQIKLSHMKLKTQPNFQVELSETDEECDCF